MKKEIHEHVTKQMREIEVKVSSHILDVSVLGNVIHINVVPIYNVLFRIDKSPFSKYDVHNGTSN